MLLGWKVFCAFWSSYGKPKRRMHSRRRTTRALSSCWVWSLVYMYASMGSDWSVVEASFGAVEVRGTESALVSPESLEPEESQPARASTVAMLPKASTDRGSWRLRMMMLILGVT